MEFVQKRLPNGKRITVPIGEDGRAVLPPEPKSIYTKERGEAVIDAYMQGASMAAIARLPGMPGEKTIQRWMRDQPDFRVRMKEARKLRGMYFEDKAIEEAENAHEKNVQSQRLKVDTMKWAAEVNDRDTYGKSTKITGDAENPVAILVDTGIQRDQELVIPTTRVDKETP